MGNLLERLQATPEWGAPINPLLLPEAAEEILRLRRLCLDLAHRRRAAEGHLEWSKSLLREARTYLDRSSDLAGRIDKMLAEDLGPFSECCTTPEKSP